MNNIKTQFKKGIIPWNKGKKIGLTHNHPFTSTFVSGENNINWKGDKVGYRSLHKWVERRLGKPNICEICLRKDKKKYEWANVSGKYKRDLLDWKRLCTSCHRKFDYERKLN